MNKFFVFVAFTFVVFACKKEAITTYDCIGVTPTYEANVKAILNKSCAFAGCHDAKTAAEKIDLSTYAMAKTHAAHDHFLGSIQQLNGYEAMPQGSSKLPDDQIKTISCWIQNGMPEK